METLPAEVVEMIALFLSIRDLKACCATTHTWRDIFSQDIVWKRHCNRALGKSLGVAKSRVKPKFVLSEEKHLKNLSPLGEWRQAYLQERLLWSHWRNGNYMAEELIIKSSNKRKRIKRRKKTMCHFVTDHYLITSCKKKVMLWDVCNRPVLVNEPFELLLTGGVNFCSKFGNNKIIIVQQSLVQIYHHGSPMKLTWSLEQSFFFDREDPVPFSKSDKIVISNRTLSCAVDENLFVGILSSGEVHVWNLMTGKKLKKIVYPGRNNPKNWIVNVVYSKKLPKDFIIIAQIAYEAYDFFVFSMADLDFYYVKECKGLEFVFPSCAVQDGLLAVGTTTSSKVYNYRTSQRMLELLPAVHKPNIGVVAIGDYFLLVKEDGIHLFNTVTLSPFDYINQMSVWGSFDYPISSCLNTICNKFLITNKYSEYMSNFDSLVCEIIYLKTKPIKIVWLRTLNFGDIVAMNSVGSKLAVATSNEDLCIVSYW